MSIETIVIISEGERTERQIVDNMKALFFDGSVSRRKSIQFLSFKTNIYTLWKVLKEDEFQTDIIEIMRERDQEAATKLRDISRNSISQIFMFFDYDGHAHNEEEVDEIIREMIETFDNETEYGKIYISYPMVEALKHIKKNDPSYKDRCVPAKQNINYKDVVSRETDFCHLSRFSLENWYHIIANHVMKAHYMRFQSFTAPEYGEYDNTCNQSSLFQCQLENYIIPQGDIAVLSGFPFFLIDYFGENIYRNSMLWLKDHSLSI